MNLADVMKIASPGDMLFMSGREYYLKGGPGRCALAVLGENKEDDMDFDFEGGIKKMGEHYLLRLGCKDIIVHNAKEAAKALEKAFKEEFEKK